MVGGCQPRQPERFRHPGLPHPGRPAVLAQRAGEHGVGRLLRELGPGPTPEVAACADRAEPAAGQPARPGRPRAGGRVTLQRDFSVVARRENFARYALFTHEHLTPDGQPIWFTSRTSFDGPVHTNGEFRFAFFPKFGAPDSLTPCDPNRARSTTLTSVSVWTWFNNLGSRVRQIS